MRLGLGTGSTAQAFVELLGARVAAGLDIVGVPTSERTAAQAKGLGIRLATLDEEPELDMTIDGADEFDPALNLDEGRRRRAVAREDRRHRLEANDRHHRRFETGRASRPLPAADRGQPLRPDHHAQLAVARVAASCGCRGDIVLRRTPEGIGLRHRRRPPAARLPFRADRRSRRTLADRLVAIPGVVEHGLFIGIATAVICAGPDGVTVLGEPDGV